VFDAHGRRVGFAAERRHLLLEAQDLVLLCFHLCCGAVKRAPEINIFGPRVGELLVSLFVTSVSLENDFIAEFVLGN